MDSLLAKLRALVADISQYVAQATPRERRLMGAGAAALSVFLLLLGTLWFAGTVGSRRSRLEEKKLGLQQIQALSADYAQREAQRSQIEARLRQSPPALMTYVDTLAHQQGIDISGIVDKGARSAGRGKPQESQIEVNLGGVRIDKLTQLLQQIEQSQGIVRVRRMHLRRAGDSKDSVDAQITISAWQEG